MNQLKNDRFIRAAFRQPVEVTPIWMMRQAGRYLPEYRAIREKAGSFMTLCKTPELACEVTLQPLQRFALDAAIIFSDILTIPDAMGLGLRVEEGKGPVFSNPVQNEAAIARLSVPDPAQLSYVYDALRLVRRELNGRVPLIGFCGSPWTLAAYMVQGHASPGFPLARKMQQEQPEWLHKLLTVLAKSVSAHLNAQIEAGAQAVMVFDTWGGMLSTSDYQTFSLHYVKEVMAGLKRSYNSVKVPVILFTKGGHAWLEQMLESDCDVLGVDWEISLKEAKARVKGKVALQGNMNPGCLLESSEKIREEAKRVLASFGQGSGHIFNLGHGITPDVPPEQVAVLVEAVHEFSKPYHKE